MSKIIAIEWSKAEQVIGERLDRRKKYGMTVDGEPTDFFGQGNHVLFVSESWTESCSGCTETVDGYNLNGYPIDKKHGCLVGGGCEECGYTGKRRIVMWFPVITGRQP